MHISASSVRDADSFQRCIYIYSLINDSRGSMPATAAARERIRYPGGLLLLEAVLSSESEGCVFIVSRGWTALSSGRRCVQLAGSHWFAREGYMRTLCWFFDNGGFISKL